MGGFSLVEDRDFEGLSTARTRVARGVMDHDSREDDAACVRE